MVLKKVDRYIMSAVHGPEMKTFITKEGLQKMKTKASFRYNFLQS